MFAKFSTFRSLNSFEKKTLLQSLFLLPTLKIGLQFFSYRRLIAFLRRTSEGKAEDKHQAQKISDLEHMVRVAAHYRFTAATCLTRSMALWWLLRRQGIESEIRFGVRRQGGEILAHAWVERDGEVVNDRPDIRQVYAAFDEVPSLNRLDWQ